MRKYVLAIVCLFLGGIHIAFAQDRQISGTVTSVEDGEYPYNAGNLILPIPEREMEANPDNLVQNPYYTGG